MNPRPSRAVMSLSAAAMSNACARLSNAQGPAIKARGSLLPKRTLPTFTVVLAAVSVVMGISLAGDLASPPVRGQPNPIGAGWAPTAAVPRFRLSCAARVPRRPRQNIKERIIMKQLTDVERAFRQATDAQKIAGVVAVAATDKEIIYEGAFGKRDIAKNEPMTVDSVFWIASMTKAVTAAGAMQLVEQGTLKLDEPIGKLLPDIATPQVLEGFDAAGAPKLRPAKPPITLRHLMTHTAGFCYAIWNA